MWRERRLLAAAASTGHGWLVVPRHQYLIPSIKSSVGRTHFYPQTNLSVPASEERDIPHINTRESNLKMVVVLQTLPCIFTVSEKHNQKAIYDGSCQQSQHLGGRSKRIRRARQTLATQQVQGQLGLHEILSKKRGEG